MVASRFTGALVVVLAVGLSSGCSSAWAQDSFDGKSAARPAPAPRSSQDRATTGSRPAAQRPDGAPAAAADQPRAAGGDHEAQDFGVPAIAQLRPNDQLHGPTPTTIPGGRVVDTRQLAQWLQGQQGPQGRVMLLHAIASPRHLPQAIAVVPASQGGRFDDQVQRDFGAYLQQATGGDRSRLMVTYCAGVQCWGSYNAALRAIHLGYKNVYWYRGGMEAWQQAGLPLLTASNPGGAAAPRPAPPPR